MGETWVCPGGKEKTADICSRAKCLKSKGCSVLDVGSGSGGAAFFMASEYGAKVTGVDIAKDMVGIANEYLENQGYGRDRQGHGRDRQGQGHGRDRSGSNASDETIKASAPKFICADFMTSKDLGTFDMVWSRDTFLHISDKAALFKSILEKLKPGGTLLFTDYGRSSKDASLMSESFQHYMTNKGYTLIDPSAYGKFCKEAGFVDVEAIDSTQDFLTILKKELRQIQDGKVDFIRKFTEKEYDDMVSGWSNKVFWCEAGDMKWSVVMAKKPLKPPLKP